MSILVPLPSDWDTLKPKIAAKIADHVSQLETLLTEREADVVRGKLQAYREIMDEAEPTARPGIGSTDYNS
jgi:hypothetical protein